MWLGALSWNKVERSEECPSAPTESRTQTWGLLGCNLDFWSFECLASFLHVACPLRCMSLKKDDRQVRPQGGLRYLLCVDAWSLAAWVQTSVPFLSLYPSYHTQREEGWVGERKASCLWIRIYSEWRMQGLKLLSAMRFPPLLFFT